MKEQNLINLGFKKNTETPESSGSTTTWHYYTLQIGDITLISNASDEISKDGWEVHIFNSNTTRIIKVNLLKKLIEILSIS